MEESWLEEGGRRSTHTYVVSKFSGVSTVSPTLIAEDPRLSTERDRYGLQQWQ